MNFEDVKVVKSDRRSFCLEISPRLEVLLRVPKRASDESVRAFFESKRKWLDKHLLIMKKKTDERSSGKMLSKEEADALMREAKELIPERVKRFADMMGVGYNKITVRRQKTRWGSCSSKKNLSFNCALLLYPEELLDYVIVHELCHLKFMNHSKEFWAEVGKYMPDYKSRRDLLKKCKTEV